MSKGLFLWFKPGKYEYRLFTRQGVCLHTSGVSFAIDVNSMDTIWKRKQTELIRLVLIQLK